MARILIVERDREAADRLGKPLGRAGWTVLIADSLAEARRILFDSHSVELALLGIRFPNGDAPELCREVLAGGGPPVILFGDREQEPALIAGLQLGADDFLVEPIHTAELLARAGAALRRTAIDSQTTALRRDVGPLTVDPATRTATIHGEPIALTPREYALLLALVRHPGQVMTRDELLSTVWGSGWTGTSKVLDVQISGLRRKLASGPGSPGLIRTVRGVGFLLAEPQSGEPQ